MPSIGVAEYYAGKSVFITGATGFMGKVLVEKLLRCCPGLKTVYVLIRSKKGQSSEDRIKEYLNNRVFERLQDDCQKALMKIRMVPGDVLLDDLNISELDRQELQRECHLIFHCAATVRFDMFLRDSVNMNVAGTLKVLKLAEEMEKLEAFVHVSTSFCHDDVDYLEEKMYPSRYKPRDIMDCMRWMEDDLIRTLEPKLIQPLPNTYAFTKCLAEDLLLEYQGKFPIAVARPSIVTAALSEPMPGWIDNLNGPTGLIVAGARGVLRTVYCDELTKEEVIPVDVAINGCILLGYFTGLEKPSEVRVCNITQSGVQVHTWKEAGDAWAKQIERYPFSVCLWYPRVTTTANRLLYVLQVFLTQFLPAVFLDLILLLLGRRPFMLHVYKKIIHGTELLKYYIAREWKFKNDYFLSLQKRISKEDNEVFYTNLSNVDIHTYMKNYVKGVREFYCKEDPSTLPEARRLHTRLYILHVTTQIAFIGLSVYLFFNLFLKYFYNKQY